MVIEKVERPSQAVEIWGRVAAGTGRCRSCGTVASRVHSRYRRRLDDVPVAGQPVVIHLTVRRFFCPAAGCSRQTFAEQVPDLTCRYGRRTPVARQVLEAIGLALGGRAGVAAAEVDDQRERDSDRPGAAASQSFRHCCGSHAAITTQTCATLRASGTAA